MILAGDIGGTKTVLALFRLEPQSEALEPVLEMTYASRDYAQFDTIITQFIAQTRCPGLEAICIGVAGPVMGGRCETTNLPWIIDAQTLAAACAIPRVILLNDLQATAYGMLFLPPDDLVDLNPQGHPRAGNIAVLAAGTGLGEAFLYWDGRDHRPVATEGGHADFAPRNPQEDALNQYLRIRFGHVSYERILSGPGIASIYAFLRDSGFAPEDPALRAALAQGDASATISARALAGDDALSVETLRLFCEIYGAEAGNLGLKTLAAGGVYIGGGIAPKIRPALASGAFMQGFLDKGRFADLLGGFPVRLSLNPKAALLGAAHYAVQARA